MRRGQITIEFSFMVMLSFVFLMVILIIVSFYLERSSNLRTKQSLEDTAVAIQQELLLAASVEDGYQRTFSIPVELEGGAYSVTNTAEVLTLELDDGTTLNKGIPLVSGNLVLGDNSLRKEGVIIILN